MIKTSNLSFRYPDQQHNTLDGIDLVIDKGDWIVIKGPSGGGKTTLALALAGYLFHYTSGDYHGRVEIGGQALEEKDFPDIAWLVYLVQQNPEDQFCTLTVRDEIAFGMENRNIEPQIINQHIKQALKIIDGEHLMDKDLLELSGGEKQKIAIATAIALKPEVIILDEPTSNLDPQATREVFEALHRMKAEDDITVIIIEHKLEQALDFADRIYTLKGGKLIEEEEQPKISSNHRVTREKIRRFNGAEPIISLQEFKVFHQDNKVVTIDNLNIYPGDFVALIGPNGSGKTSLLLGLLNLLKTRADSYMLGNQPIISMKQQEIIQQCGIVFQNPDHQLFCSSVEEEAFLAPGNFKKNDAETRSSVISMLNDLGFADRLKMHPFQLSFGQKKRLNLASILAYEPRLLLLDEIFIGQDDENIVKALQMITSYQEQKDAAVILVNHYLNPLTELANRLIFLDQGSILFDVPMEEHISNLKIHQKQEYIPV